jgi:Holliday junction resolvase
MLVNYLAKRGYAVMRAPASGRKGSRIHYPDIIAVKDGRTLVFEVKYRSRLDTVYLTPEQVEALKEYARRSGGEAYVAVLVKGWRWMKVVPVDELEECELDGRRMYRIPVHKLKSAKEVREIV